jgi:hypothetical protein
MCNCTQRGHERLRHITHEFSLNPNTTVMDSFHLAQSYMYGFVAVL